jgi:RNA polymerase sigma-70 factor (ECF subfamily)
VGHVLLLYESASDLNAVMELDTGSTEKSAAPPRPLSACAGVNTGEKLSREEWWYEGATVETELIDRARSGDQRAFERLVEPYRRELQVHAYRMLGSVAEAEDALQETLLAAWQGLRSFEGRASIRTWLYRIATTRSLNMLRSASRRPEANLPPLEVPPPAPTRLGDVVWLEPYPDVLLQDLADTRIGPEARYETREAISLAFVTALQLLPPQQRAVLVLRDVLDFSAREVAGMLNTTEQAVSSALKRARATLQREIPADTAPTPAPSAEVEGELLARLVQAFEDADVDGIVALMAEDAWLRMPPVPLEYQGRELARTFFATVAFRNDRRYRLIPTHANRQPAFGVYLWDPSTQLSRAFGLLVITVSGDQITAITRFDNAVLPHFGLPRTLVG